MLETRFNENAAQLLELIQKKLPHATYFSVLLFRKGKLIKSINNNYNDWANNYNEVDMSHDNVFFEISHKKLKESNNTICFWNSVPHSSKESAEIHERRAQFGLFNGVTVLELVDDEYTLGINLTSDNVIEEDVFYSKVILNRKLFMNTLRKILNL